MVQGVRAGGRFFLGNGMLDPIDYSGDFDRRTGLRREEAPFRRTTSSLREVDEQQRRQQVSPDERQRRLPVQMRLGSRPLQEVARGLQDRFRHGGTFLQIEDGPLTFERGEESLTIESGTAARFYRSGRQEITLQDRETGEELTFQAGDQLQLTGTGRADFGVLSPFELTAEDQFTVEQTEEGPAITRPATEQAQTIARLEEPPDPEGPLQMEVYRDPQTDQLRDLYYQLVQQPLAAEEEETEDPPTLAELMEENNNPNNSPENISNSNPGEEPESADENTSEELEIQAEEVSAETPEISPEELENFETSETEINFSEPPEQLSAETEQLDRHYSFQEQSPGAELNLYA